MRYINKRRLEKSAKVFKSFSTLVLGLATISLGLFATTLWIVVLTK